MGETGKGAAPRLLSAHRMPYTVLNTECASPVSAPSPWGPVDPRRRPARGAQPGRLDIAPRFAARSRFCVSRYKGAKTHLIKSSTKMLPLLPRERKATQRTPPAGVRQTSIASFFTLQSGKKNGDQRSVSSYIESQTNRESKKDATQLDHLTQGLGDDCVAPPLASSTPTDIQEAGLSPQSLQASGHHRLGTPFLTVLSLFQPETNLVCAGENQDSLACSFTQDVESSCLLDQKEGEKDSSWKREWLHGI
ncbi:hypothetical protein D623_10029686 [Myotis brandtii]|uniref:Uncharacterized protein n=1 Tax=Myotis brandtii TaxID=109478 RepID=S7PXI7_MYOBR|nr:hypothetical protein D623_10029686 [Myotis brandtii]